MVQRLALVLLLVSPFAATALRALDLYAGAGLGQSVEAGSLRSEFGQLGSDSSGSRYKLLAGIVLGKHLGVEASYYDFGKQSCCAGLVDNGFTSQVDATSLALLGRLSFGRLHAFGKVGLFHWREDGEVVTLLGSLPRSLSGNDLLTGVGADVDLIGLLRLRLELERYEFGDTSSDALWGAVILHF